jgi:outer membrane biosynthesis protein TonB
MQTGVSVKAGAAFFAGVVLALGGAYTYFKVTDSHVVPVSQPVTKVEQSSATVPDLTPAPNVTEVPVDNPPPVPEPTPTRPTVVKAVPPKLVLPKPKPTSRPVSLAVAKPPNQYQEPVPPPVQPPPTPDVPPAQAPLPAAAAPVIVQAPPAPLPPPQPHTVTVPAGTRIAVRLNEKLSTDHNYTGDTFRATLDTPIVIDGFIIADRGAKVLGRIVKAQKPGNGGAGSDINRNFHDRWTKDEG